MSLQRLKLVRDDARLCHLVGNGVFHVFYLRTELVRHDLHEPSRAAFLIGRSVHQA